MASSSRPETARKMQCMEIWGGSHAAEETLSTPGLDAWVYSLPHDGADNGGDLHYLSVCGGGITTRLLLADVSGHGAQVADFAASLRALLRKNINTKSQTRLVRTLNRQFFDLAQCQRFATAVIATYLATQKRLTVCNAGHPRPLWYHAEAGEWSLLEPDAGTTGNLPLGIDDETPYHQFAVSLGRGDVVLFYTDALSEAADHSDRMLGEEGLLEVVRGLDVDDVHQIGPALLAVVAAHRGGRPSNDDTTLVTLVHEATGPRQLTLAEKLDVYAKVFGLRSY